MYQKKKARNKWKYEGSQKHDILSLTTVTLTAPQYRKTFTKHTLLSSEKSMCVCTNVCACFGVRLCVLTCDVQLACAMYTPGLI